MSRCNDEVKSQWYQAFMVKAIFLVVLFVISVDCDHKKQPKKRDVHRIVIIPDRHRNNKMRPTRGGSYTHYFNSPDLQVQPTQFSNGLNQISYHNKMKLPSKNRYHEMQLPDHFFKDSFLDGSTIHVFNSKNGWKPIPGKSHNQHQFLHSPKFNYLPSLSSTASSSSIPKHSSSTTTSRRPTATSSQYKTNKKINRGKNRFSTTGIPRHKSVAELIELTTAFPQPLPPVQTYLNIMTDSHQTADQSQSYMYQNVLVRPRLKKITTITTSTTTHTPKTKKIATKLTTSKPYEVYENIDEDFPSPVAASESGVKVQNYGKRNKSRRPVRPKTTKK